jgi:hypothetical protein
MKIKFIAEEFTPGFLQRGAIDVSWPDLVWAATTYGKNHGYLWGSSSGFVRAERQYRTYLLYSCLKQVSKTAFKTHGYNAMDATEKGAASYFLGMTLAKLSAERLLDTPWVWHISSGSQALSFLPGRSRPDMLGLDKSGRWIVLEAKGRTGKLDMNALHSAKNQTRMVGTINGATPFCRVGVQSYFDPDLQVYLIDPEPLDEMLPIEFDIEKAMDEYYGFRHVLKNFGRKRRISNIEYLVFDERESGVKIGLPKAIVEDYDRLKISEILSDIPARNIIPMSFTSENFDLSSELSKRISFIAKLQDDNNQAQELKNNSGLYADGFFIELDERWDVKNMTLEPFDR